MAEDPPTPPPDTPAPRAPGGAVGAAFSGETTGSAANFPTGEETVMMGAGSSASAQVIGDFEVLSKLGQGGMGAVYRARQKSLDRQVALKILPSTLEADADFVSRFQREARVAASLNHANLVKVYASGAADGTHFIAMELIEGETLGDWLKRGPLPPLEALRICGDVARALEHGWNRAQLIHRDIKPGNIFLSVHGDVKVGDLGLAKTMSGDTTGLTHTGTAMGTPHYISPEQARGDKDLDFRADIYSLGCTLFQMLTGRTPYEGRDPMSVMYQHINSPPPAILKVLPQCPIPLARLVGKMLKKIKRERQTSYAELLAEIERVSALFAPTASVLESALPPDPDSTLLATPGHTPRSATPVTAPVVAPTKSSAPKSKAGLYGGLVAGVLVLGIVAFLVWPKPEKLSKAEIMAKQREAERAAATPEPGGTRSSASPKVASASANEPWRDWLAPVAGKLPEEFEQAGDQVRVITNVGRYWGNLRDGGIRLVWKPTPDSNPILSVRVTDAGSYRLIFGEAIALQEYSRDASVGALPTLAKWPLPAGFDASREHTLELRAVGDQLSVRLDGALLGSGRAETIRPGALGFSAKPGTVFRKVEFLIGAGASASTPPTAESWEDVLSDPTLVVSGAAEMVPEGLRLSGVGRAYIREGATPPNGAVRMRAVFGGSRPELRARMNVLFGSYQLLVANERLIRLARLHKDATQNTALRDFPLREALRAGQDYELELRVTGQSLTAKLNGEVLGTMQDATFASGHFAVGCNEDRGPVLIKSLEVLDLDKPATASTPATSEPWTDALAEWWAGPNAGQILVKDGTGAKVLDRTGIYLANRAPVGDVAVRMTIRGLTDYCAIFLRQQRREDGVTRQYQAALQRDGSTKLRLVLEKTGELAGSPPIAGFDPAKSHTLEFSAHGDQLRIMLDGTEVVAAQNRTIANGILAIVADPGAIIEKLEYRMLGGASASPSASSAPAAPEVGAPALEPGAMRLWDSPEKIPTGRTGIQWKDDALYISSTTLVVEAGKTPLRQRDSILRFALRTNPAAQGASIVVRDAGTPKTPRLYSLRLSPKDKLIEFWSGNGEPQQRKLQTWPFPRAYGDDEWMRVEFRTVGDLFTVTVDGALLGTVRDATRPDAGLMHFGSAAACYFRDIVYVPLDAASGTAPAVSGGIPAAAATKDAPFVNGLGMKFVPVTITGGPTGEKRVLFSIWETRVQDFELFATETKRPWPKPDFEQGPTHPAVGINREDARAFCVWLTERERKAGRLGANEVYRLPSDHEWSCAIGIGDREDAARSPAEKSDLLPDIFPWGSGRLPPPDTINYPGEELAPLVAAGKYPHLKGVLQGHRDPFPETSPVGSFAANAAGLYDMAGNAWEWCADWSDDTQKLAVLRGGSWDNTDRTFLRSAKRHRMPPTTANTRYGFRVVLAPETPQAAASQAAASPAAATKDAPFVNGLGMKFVPVPIIGGPTEGKRVLCSVWETRVQDYAAFATETKREWPQPGFAQGPTHPAVMAHWDDAQSFAKWLTERERKAGRLGADEVYRLPTDHEWSCAVGIGRREVATKLPDEKDGVLTDALPWGQLWPPPPGVGNFAGEELRPALAAGKYGNIKSVLAGYRDEVMETAPVGQFPANPIGLQDLGGNAREWCADWLDVAQKYRVLRGGSWNSGNLEQLLSSNRSRGLPGARNDDLGFRIVLAPVP